MKKTIKCASIFALATLLLAMSVYVPFHNASAATTYNNAASAALFCEVNSNGRLKATLSASGISGVTSRIKVELYVEKRVLLFFWSRVDIGCEDNVWKDSVNGFNYTNTFQTNLSSTGTYRTTVTYTFSGSGGADDVITKTYTVTY